jgi:cell division septation protein DedD
MFAIAVFVTLALSQFVAAQSGAYGQVCLLPVSCAVCILKEASSSVVVKSEMSAGGLRRAVLILAIQLEWCYHLHLWLQCVLPVALLWVSSHAERYAACTYSNPYYSQCLPGSAPTTTPVTTSPVTTSPVTTSPGTTSPGTTATPTKTSPSPTGTGTCASAPAKTLLPNQLWQRVDEAPYFHYYGSCTCPIVNVVAHIFSVLQFSP